MPKISFIIPVYNAEKYLERCLESVVKQTLKDIEIVCVDDGSSDQSLDILKAYAQKDPRIRIFEQPNGGPAKARNTGLRNATGDYVWLVDADDQCVTDASEKLYARALADDLDMLIFSVKFNLATSCADVNDVSKNRYYAIQHLLPEDAKNAVVDIEKAHSYLFKFPRENWCRIYKTATLNKLKLEFCETISLYDDILLTVTSLFLMKRIGFSTECCYCYELGHPNSIMDTVTKRLDGALIYVDEIINLIKKNSIPKEVVFSWAEREFSSLKYWLTQVNLDLSDYYKKLGYFYNHLDPELFPKAVVKKFSCYKDIKNIQTLTYHEYKELIIQRTGNVKRKRIFGCTIFAKYTYDGGRKYKFLGFPIYQKEQIGRDKHNFTGHSKTYYRLFGIKVFRKKDRMIDFGGLKRNIGNDISIRIQRGITTAFLHQKIFPKYKNLYADKSVVLFGAGSSINLFEPLRDVIYVGCNRAFLYDKVKFDYLFTSDKIGIENFYDEFIAYQGNNCQKFVGDLNYKPEYQIPESVVCRIGGNKYKTTNGICGFKFALDLDTEPIGAFHTISLQAMQFILYTNPATVYLVGIDCGNNGKHFSGQEHDVSARGENIENLQNWQIQEWKQLKEFARVYYPETEIISVNPVGLAGVFKDIYTNINQEI